MDKSRLIQSLLDGDAEKLQSTDIDKLLLSDPDVLLAAARASNNVVFHRPNYREAIQRIVECGASCDIWTLSRAGLVEPVKAMLAAKPELLNATDKLGRTALQRAALVYGKCKECEEVVDLLLSLSATVDIYSACTLGLTDIVRQSVLQHPHQLSVKCLGSTPLNWAVRPRRNETESPEICQLLLDAGADVNDQDDHENGMTPLHHAAEWGPTVCIKLVDQLLKAGADINATDDQNWTALDYAQDRGRQEMIHHLQNGGGVSTRHS